MNNQDDKNKLERGHPEYEPTDLARQKVIAFSCAGFSQAQIANYLDIDEKTLRKYYRYELDSAKLERLGDISNLAYVKAMEGSEKMIEFVLKTQARWAYAKAQEDIDKDDKYNSLLEKVIDKL